MMEIRKSLFHLLLVLAYLILLIAGSDVNVVLSQQQSILELDREPGIVTDWSSSLASDRSTIKPLYNSTKVLDLRKRVKRRYQKATLATPRIVVTTRKAHGFGSIINLILMTFQLAETEGMNRLLQVYSAKFEYGPLQNYFYPFDAINSDGTFPRDFLLDEHLQQTSMSLYIVNDLQVDFENFEVEFSIADSGKLVAKEVEVYEYHPIPFAIRHSTGKNYNQVQDKFNDHLIKHLTVEEIIESRRIVAQAFWEPLPFIRNAIDKIIAMLPAGPWITVQVRRGDKLHAESKDHRPRDYVAKMDLIMKREPKIASIVLISDDSLYLESMIPHITASKYFRSSIDVLMVNDLLMEVFGSIQRQFVFWGWGWNYLEEATEKQMYEHTRDLIVSLTLMAKSDYAVCTFSSNICRLAQLLRTHPIDTVYSLDENWHPK